MACMHRAFLTRAGGSVHGHSVSSMLYQVLTLELQARPSAYACLEQSVPRCAGEPPIPAQHSLRTATARRAASWAAAPT